MTDIDGTDPLKKPVETELNRAGNIPPASEDSADLSQDFLFEDTPASDEELRAEEAKFEQALIERGKNLFDADSVTPTEIFSFVRANLGSEAALAAFCYATTVLGVEDLTNLAKQCAFAFESNMQIDKGILNKSVEILIEQGEYGQWKESIQRLLQSNRGDYYGILTVIPGFRKVNNLRRHSVGKSPRYRALVYLSQLYRHDLIQDFAEDIKTIALDRKNSDAMRRKALGLFRGVGESVCEAEEVRQILLDACKDSSLFVRREISFMFANGGLGTGADIVKNLTDGELADIFYDKKYYSDMRALAVVALIERKSELAEDILQQALNHSDRRLAGYVRISVEYDQI